MCEFKTDRHQALNRGLSLRVGATGLVEVLVVIGILSLSMVTIVVVTTRSLVRIKKDEVHDQATGIQYRALEYAKTPGDLCVQMDPGEINYYKFEKSQEGEFLVRTVGAYELDENNCSNSSEYYMDLSGNGVEVPSGSIFCNQVVLEALPLAEQTRVFKVRSILVYNLEGEFVREELLGYRREAI